MCVPHRFDLHVNSCVNKEVEVFNRRLSKQMKILDHPALLQIDSNRELFTKHGLHMNDKGRELAAKKIASTIKYILQDKIIEPICMTWKEDDIKKSQKNHNTQAYEEERNCPGLKRGMVDTQEGNVLQRDRCQDQNQDTTTTMPSRRLRKPPSTRRDDFLWMGDSKIKT